MGIQGALAARPLFRSLAGRIGLTAIGDTLEEARGLYYDVKAAVDKAAGVST